MTYDTVLQGLQEEAVIHVQYIRSYTLHMHYFEICKHPS